MRTCHTLPELIPGYVHAGVDKPRAVSYIVDCHLRSAIARGRGNRAARRSAAIERVCEPVRVRTAGNDQNAAIAEYEAEGRCFNREPKTNYHDE